ncbi:helix-turn-helix family protein [Yersinia pseudotuberculosis]|uniref:helix-turn-helix transcriptional regulator n=1 Tax=Yersinia pseudotuberculosis TaxID=633 RepID=UPI0003D6145F|nr:helix-turn-helix transcriptional regulator [Yersinia pseudotuberculosis]CQD58452.1 bacteriophage CI repressor protein [Yersinia intermedia]AJJ01828.1 helix-turn-helix family protein [Yersinia pseudotuberculosis]AJJ70153.1 helix-turn-helix family protein [Yersinia pseudotuberculosis]MCF1165351.1 helix-turn-helix domain-containing protein [Yersinia pseudotuberculosis]PSH14425.1 transcriptional regulator [Yersinia pseudotuberculosis]
MSIHDNEKLKAIRQSERLNMREMSDLIGINYTTYAGYESGKAKVSLEAGKKLFKHSRFRKYRDWFMFDEINPEAGQIAPALSPDGPHGIISTQSGKEIG